MALTVMFLCPSSLAQHFVSPIIPCFATEYDTHIKNDEYFPGCPFKLYRRTYYDRFDNYILNYPAGDEFDFLNQENQIIKKLLEMHPENNENFYSFYNYLFPNSHQKILKSSLLQIRRNFIDKRIIELDHYFSITGVDPINYHKMPMQHIGLLRNPDQRNINKPQFYQPFGINSEKISNPDNSENIAFLSYLEHFTTNDW